MRYRFGSFCATLVVAPLFSATPVISSVTTADGPADISQNTWIAIKGTGLVPSSTPAGGMFWSNAPEFASGKMPTQLGGVSVTINGIPAYVYWFCSAGTTQTCPLDQINVLTPLDTRTGNVPVVVSNGSGISQPFIVLEQKISPAFLLLDAAGHIAAMHADYTLVGPTTLYPGLSTPAKPGETIALFGVGFGLPTAILTQGSAVQSGVLGTPPTCLMVSSTGATQAMTVLNSSLISPGLYQLNVAVPESIDAGDSKVGCQAFSDGVSQSVNVGLITVALGGITSGGGGGNSGLLGKSFNLNGTLTIGNESTSIEINAVATGNTYALVAIQPLVLGQVLQVDILLEAVTPTITGNSVFVSASMGVTGVYGNTTQLVGVTSAILSLNFDAVAAGAPVKGALTFECPRGTIQGTFTGSVFGPIR